MKRKVTSALEKFMFIGLFILISATVAMAASKVKHAIIGSVETIDKTAKTIAVKTADGTVETIKWTGKTAIHGLKEVGKAADFAGREGSHVVVHYTVKGAEKTASAFEYLGRETPKAAEGTIKVVGKGAKTVIVKTGDGAEEVFDLSERAVVDTGKGIEDAAKFTARETSDGAKVTVHYTEEGGRKIAHFIKHL
ncbi:MAG TPA: hypothetical protein VF692_11515 [Pyrinomonadaceae bacterium]|jgi:hypothetical protein